MKNTIKIDVKKTGFPVNIGGVELWLDTSVENLQRLTKANAEVNERLKKLGTKAKGIKLPKGINEENIDSLDPKIIDSALGLHKEFIAAQYDVIFGEGTFKKLYKEHPNVEALEDALETVAPIVAKEIENVTKKSAL